MSAVEPKPLTAEERTKILAFIDNPWGNIPEDDYDGDDWMRIRDQHSTEEYMFGFIAWYEQREAHVIAVLRQAERCGGGYGFARQLLRYLGADQEGQVAAVNPVADAIAKVWDGLNALEATAFMDTSDREASFYRLRGHLRVVELVARERGLLV